MHNLTFSDILILGAIIVFLSHIIYIFNKALNFHSSLAFLLINTKIN